MKRTLLKSVIYLATAMLWSIHFMTAIVCEPGDFGYRLVIKPYPSRLKVVPHLEDWKWKNEVASGKIPSWVADEHYTVIGFGSDEIPEKNAWEYWYGLCCWLTPISLFASLAMLAPGLVRKRPLYSASAVLALFLIV